MTGPLVFQNISQSRPAFLCSKEALDPEYRREIGLREDSRLDGQPFETTHPVTKTRPRNKTKMINRAANQAHQLQYQLHSLFKSSFADPAVAIPQQTLPAATPPEVSCSPRSRGSGGSPVSNGPLSSCRGSSTPSSKSAPSTYATPPVTAAMLSSVVRNVVSGAPGTAAMGGFPPHPSPYLGILTVPGSTFVADPLSNAFNLTGKNLIGKNRLRHYLTLFLRLAHF